MAFNVGVADLNKNDIGISFNRIVTAVVVLVLANLLWFFTLISIVFPVILSFASPRIVAGIAGRKPILWGLATNLAWTPVFLVGSVANSWTWRNDAAGMILVMTVLVAWQSLAALAVCYPLHRRALKALAAPEVPLVLSGPPASAADLQFVASFEREVGLQVRWNRAWMIGSIVLVVATAVALVLPSPWVVCVAPFAAASVWQAMSVRGHPGMETTRDARLVGALMRVCRNTPFRRSAQHGLLNVLPMVRDVDAQWIDADAMRNLLWLLYGARDYRLVVAVLDALEYVGDYRCIEPVERIRQTPQYTFSFSRTNQEADEIVRAADRCLLNVRRRIAEAMESSTLMRSATGPDQSVLVRPATGGNPDSPGLLRPTDVAGGSSK
jgi:hypothetical protein